MGATILGLDGQIFFTLKDVIRRQDQIRRVNDAACWLSWTPIDEYQRGAYALDRVGHLVGE
jgi:hypothetical protein